MTTAEARRKQLAWIHQLKKQRGMADDEYRVLLQSVAGVESCRDADDHQLNRILDAMRGKAVAPLRKGKPLPKSRHLPPEWKRRDHKIVALWCELARQGVLRDSSHEGLSNFCRRFIRRKVALLPGVDPFDALTEKERNAVIEALKEWLNRTQWGLK